MRCQSQICIVNKDGIRGREFEPPKDAKNLSKIWCPQCISLISQIQFFSGQTIDMIRDVYQTYNNTALPKEVKLILTQFSREIIINLGGEL